MCRVVLTAESILLLNLRPVEIVDMIPFAEIMDAIDVMDNEEYLPLTMKGFEPSRLLQITRAEYGFNCGRIYRFKPLSDTLQVEIIKLARESNVIKKGSLGRRARLKFWQSQVRAGFESKPVQYMLALSIMAVINQYINSLIYARFPAHVLHFSLNRRYCARTFPSTSWSPS
jgi:hypothetical protein